VSRLFCPDSCRSETNLGCRGNPELADDLAQETFVHAWKSLGKLRSPGAFGGWLRQIALHIWLQHARRARIPMDDYFDEENLLDAVMPNPGDAMDLDRALAVLRPPERVCIVLNLGEGMSHGEIADATGFAFGTVKSHLARGTAKLRALLEQH
jgi:RNA polymerase sigma-70 factor (ECF subfamily)